MNILPQIAQITQRNAASCIITQRKTDRDVVVVIAVLGFGVLSAIISVICERIGRSCEIGLIILWLTCQT